MFINLGFINEVMKLDVYFELVMIYDKKGNLIKIL